MVCKMKISTGQIRQVTCSMSEYNRKCTISGLTLSLKNYTFFPVAYDSNHVNKIEIKSSTVPVLTSDICTTFPKLKNFIAPEQHIEIIEDYAFNNCTELIEINLERNNIHKLGKGVFSNAKQLQRLHILGASLEQFDTDLFSNLTELKQIVYGASGLKELPVVAIKNLKKLQYLYLYSNELSDLDAEGLIENLPNLKTIYINDNNFHCDRLIEIMAAFKAENIIVHDHTYTTYIKKRDYVPRKINNIICLTQAQLESEKLKKALTSSLDELKQYPIGKAVIQLKDVVSSGFVDADSNIVSLYNTLNETSGNLTKQISNLNETLDNISNQFSETVNDLKENMTNQIEEQQILATQLNVTIKRIQEIADSVTFLMDNLTFSNKLSDNQGYESLNHNIVAIWVFLIFLLFFVVGVSFFVYIRLRNIHIDVPILRYESGSDRIDHEKQESSTRSST